MNVAEIKMKNVAVIGECMVEIQTHKSGCARGFGGDTMNTAIYLSRLGLPVYDDDIPVSASYFSAFGLDKKALILSTSVVLKG